MSLIDEFELCDCTIGGDTFYITYNGRAVLAIGKQLDDLVITVLSYNTRIKNNRNFIIDLNQYGDGVE